MVALGCCLGEYTGRPTVCRARIVLLFGRPPTYRRPAIPLLYRRPAILLLYRRPVILLLYRRPAILLLYRRLGGALWSYEKIGHKSWHMLRRDQHHNTRSETPELCLMRLWRYRAIALFNGAMALGRVWGVALGSVG